MKKILLFLLSLVLMLGLVACDKEEANINMNGINGKIYTYEGDGFGGDFTIQINDDGSSVFYEGYLSSYMGISNWTIDDHTLTISDGTFTNKFRVNDNELVFVEDGSTNFLHIKLKDGEKFICDLKNDK